MHLCPSIQCLSASFLFSVILHSFPRCGTCILKTHPECMCPKAKVHEFKGITNVICIHNGTSLLKFFLCLKQRKGLTSNVVYENIAQLFCFLILNSLKKIKTKDTKIPELWSYLLITLIKYLLFFFSLPSNKDSKRQPGMTLLYFRIRFDF